MHKTMTIAVLILAGCGGVDFVGSYSGTVTQLVTCGTKAVTTGASATLVLKEGPGADEVSWDAGVACGTQTARVNDTVATLNAKACAVETDAEGNQVTTTYSDGTLTLNGTALQLTLRANLAIRKADNSNATCTRVETATLAKQ